MPFIRPTYVCYYECSGWNSQVEIMNLDDLPGICVIQVFPNPGGPAVWANNINLAPHETRTVSIDAFAPIHEGMVTVSPTAQYKGREFPSVLKILAQGGDINKELRYVPFIRVTTAF